MFTNKEIKELAGNVSGLDFIQRHAPHALVSVLVHGLHEGHDRELLMKDVLALIATYSVLVDSWQELDLEELAGRELPAGFRLEAVTLEHQARN